MLLIILSMTLFQVNAAEIDFHQGLTTEQQSSFENMSKPLITLYSMLKYFASVGGAIYLVIAGIGFMTAGSNSKNRDEAKMKATGVVLGLVVIWIAPMLVTIMMA